MKVYVALSLLCVFVAYTHSLQLNQRPRPGPTSRPIPLYSREADNIVQDITEYYGPNEVILPFNVRQFHPFPEYTLYYYRFAKSDPRPIYICIAAVNYGLMPIHFHEEMCEVYEGQLL